MKKIEIVAGNVQVQAELYDTPTAVAIANVLPVSGSANTWGEEIYFSITPELSLEPGAKQEVETGELAYWPSGPAFCIFFGKTPVSISDKPRAYSPVNVFGKITGDISMLKKVENGDSITVRAL